MTTTRGSVRSGSLVIACSRGVGPTLSLGDHGIVVTVMSVHADGDHLCRILTDRGLIDLWFVNRTFITKDTTWCLSDVNLAVEIPAGASVGT